MGSGGVLSKYSSAAFLELPDAAGATAALLVAACSVVGVVVASDAAAGDAGAAGAFAELLFASVAPPVANVVAGHFGGSVDARRRAVGIAALRDVAVRQGFIFSSCIKMDAMLRQSSIPE